MKFRILESGMIRGGSLDVVLHENGDVYDCDYSAELKLGKKVFGKWIALPGISRSGSARIDRKYLSETYIANMTGDIDISGVVVSKSSDSLLRFRKNDVVGFVTISMDGLDPVEIIGLEVTWGGYKVTAVMA